MNAHPEVISELEPDGKSDVSAQDDDRLGAVGALALADPAGFAEKLDWRVSETHEGLYFEDMSSSAAAMFQSKTWLGNWFSTVGKSREDKLKVVAGYLGGQCLVCIPFMITSYRFFSVAKLAAQGVSDYNQVLLHPRLGEVASCELMQTLWSKGAEFLPEVDLLDLRKVLCQQPPSHLPLLYRRESEDSHVAKLGDDWAEDLKHFVGKSSRRSLNRKLKSLEKLGSVSFREVGEKLDKHAAVEILANWKKEQLNELGAANRFRDTEFVKFLKAAATNDESGIVRIFGMYLDDKPIALTYMLCSDSRWFLYQTAYTSDDTSRFSPGYHLLLDIMQRASESGVRVFDFGWGNEGYKSRFANESISLYRVSLPRTFKGYVVMHLTSLMLSLKSFVKSNAVLRPVATAILRLKS